MRNSIGLIEVVGLVGALEAADAAAKSANVQLVGMETAKGFGMITVKIEGEVSAVQAAVDAGVMAASRLTKVVSKLVIARPDKNTYSLIDTYVEKKVETTEIKEVEVKEDNVEKNTEIFEEVNEVKEMNKNNKKNKK